MFTRVGPWPAVYVLRNEPILFSRMFMEVSIPANRQRVGEDSCQPRNSDFVPSEKFLSENR